MTVVGTDREARADVRASLCRHIDGMAVGSTVAALHERGVLARLLGTGSFAVEGLAEEFDARPGHLAVALRLLADQGWVCTSGGAGERSLHSTRRGRAVLRHADRYVLAAGFLPRAEELLRGLGEPAGDGSPTIAWACELLEDDWRLPAAGADGEVRRQLLGHLDGHVVGPAVVALVRAGVLGPRASEAVLPGPASEHEVALGLLRVLAARGWVRPQDGVFALTDHGRLAVRWSAQYWHPLSYLPTFRAVPELLFGAPGRAFPAAVAVEEPHLDRALDLDFSGEVFSATCEGPALDVALGPFTAGPLDEQPRLLVDTGCGDGRLLEALYVAVRERTARGRQLDRHPLLAVAVEPSDVGREASADRLRAAGIPHLVIDGDIGDPEALCARLRELGHDPATALHLSKSVVHDRAHEPAPPGSPEPHGLPLRGAFVAPDGTAIPPGAVAAGLCALLTRWRRVLGRHGMVVVEAHAIDPRATAGLVGRSLHTALDASHGYTNQYPVEAEVFAWAAGAAGLVSRAHEEPAGRRFGGSALTIDHFVGDVP